MNPVNVPTLLTHLQLSTATSTLRRQSEIARTEVATGRITDAALKLGSDAGAASLLRRALDNIGAHRQAIGRAELRLGAIQSVISDVSSGAQALDADLLSAIGRGDEPTIRILGEEAREKFDKAVARLNIRVEGRSIFAGDAVDRPALADSGALFVDVAQIYANAADATQLQSDLDFYFNDPAGGFAATIYLGGTGSPSALSIAEGESVAGDVKADDPAFKDVLRGLAVIAAASVAPKSQYRDDALAVAGSTALQGSSALNNVGARIGIEQQNAVAADARLNAEESALTQAYDEKTAVDQFEAASRLQLLESQLQAAYVLTSRLSRLSLANFL